MMVNNHMAQSYLKNKVESATPIGRILILFEACFRFIDQSREALVRGEKLLFVDSNIKAQNIVREFRNALNLDVDEKVAGGLYNIYNYVIKQLMQSVRTRKVEPLDHARKLLDGLYQSWKQAEKQGLGKELKNPEDRASRAEPSKLRTVSGTQTHYLQASAGLNIVS
jgi:flagellar secretion chaperone FliS